MKLKLLVLPLLVASLLTGCDDDGNPFGSSSTAQISSEQESSEELSSKERIQYKHYALSDIFEARKNNKLAELKDQGVITDGQITFIKLNSSTENTVIVIQNGKHAVEISTDVTDQFSVGQNVRVTGKFTYYSDHFGINVFPSLYDGAGISEYDNQATVEEVTSIANVEDLKNYNNSKMDLTLTVVDETKPNAVVFAGKLEGTDDVFWVARKLGISETITDVTFNAGDKVKLHGIFQLNKVDESNLLRYYDASYVSIVK